MRIRKFLRAIDIMGHNVKLDDIGIESALKSAGFSGREAALLVALVPSAFARPVLEKLGFTHFVESVSARNVDGEWVQVPLRKVQLYQLALTIARRHYAGGALDHEHYKGLASRSAELNAASNALNSGAKLGGSTIATALIGVSAEDLVHGSWYARLRRAIAV
jgi:hypothetical protein